MKVPLAMAVRPNSVTFRPVLGTAPSLGFRIGEHVRLQPGRQQWLSCTTLDSNAWAMHDLCMATKTISIEIDAYELLVREKRDPKESFSRVIRRVLSERPALTAGDLLEAMEAFQGKGAGPRRRRDRNAAA